MKIEPFYTHSLEEIIKLYQETFFIENTVAIALVAAILIHSKLKSPPIWLYLIGPSSGGKSTIMEAFAQVPFATQVSDLTVNTFLSGFSSSKKEASLLKRLGDNFTILMKDFTTILNKPEESQAAIIAQMREIYDGFITKETGTGVTLAWGGKETSKKGHATFIMACTEEIYSMQDKFASMGTRATNYVLPPENRRKPTERALRNNNKMDTAMGHIQEVFKTFVMERIAALPDELPYVSEELEQEIIDVADFSSSCRSVVKRDYKNVAELALSAEMPMRIAKQLLGAAQTLAYLNKGVLTPEYRDCVFKLGIDSIPKQRRLIIETLARYNRSTTSGVSDKINYPPDTCKKWLDDLQMFGIIERFKKGDKQYWKLRDNIKAIMQKYFKIAGANEDLEGESDTVMGYNDTAGNYNEVDNSHELSEAIAESTRQADMTWDQKL